MEHGMQDLVNSITIQYIHQNRATMRTLQYRIKNYFQHCFAYIGYICL